MKGVDIQGRDACYIFVSGSSYMPSTARAHHFVPESMLLGFTKSGQKDDKIWVCDLVTKKEWSTRPRNVAHRRDLYRVDVEGVPPDFVEQRLLAPVESGAIGIIRDLERTRTLPSDATAIELLLFFVALLITRVPLARFMVDDVVNRANRRQIADFLKSPEAWGAVLRDMQGMGIDVTGMEYTEMQDHFPKMRFAATQHFQIQMMLESAFALVPTLRFRRWSIAESTGGNLICSDRPVILAYATPPPWKSYPGLALPNTDVFVPLTRHILLRGTWPTREIPPNLLKYKGVAHINSLVLDRAERYVFAHANDFPWMNRISTVRYGITDLPRKSDKPVVLYK